MPKATPIQEAFTSGEISPMFYGRVREERYSQSMATTLNYLPLLQGPLVRRPGSKNVTNVKNNNTAVILIPFTYSSSINYILEVGLGYMRFYTNNGQVSTPGSYYQIYSSLGNFIRANLTPLANETIYSYNNISGPIVMEMVTPWATAGDLPLLRWAQDKDTLYITHPYYCPRKLKLLDSTGYNWGLSVHFLLDGPFLPYNTWSTPADNKNISLVPSATSGNVGITTAPSYSISGAANNGSGLIRITTSAPHQYFNGQTVFVTGVGGTTEANNVQFGTAGATYWTISFVDSTHFDLIGSAFVHSYTSGGTVYPAVFINPNAPGGPAVLASEQAQQLALTYGTVRSYGIITYNNTASGTWQTGFGQAIAGTSACTFWQMGLYQPRSVDRVSGVVVNGIQPAVLTFHQDRLFLGACALALQEIDGSVTATYDTFSVSNGLTAEVSDDNALQFNLVSRKANGLRWLSSSSQGMLAGGYESEWSVTPDANSGVLTPTNISAQETSYFGSYSADAIRLGNASLYIQRAQRKLREMNFFFQIGTFRSTDLSELSEHITIPGIQKLVVSKETIPLIWALRTDGQLLTMTYNRDDTSIKAGWARHTLGGQSDAGGSAPVVLDAAVIPDPGGAFDQVWLAVKRWINGTSYVSVEYLTKVYDDSFVQEDAFQFDCGATFYNAQSPLAFTFANNIGVLFSGTSTGFSNGDIVKITGVIGGNVSTTDIDGNVTVTNQINEKTFQLANVTPGGGFTILTLNDTNGNVVNASTWSPYVSGGNVAKLITSVSGLTWLEGETLGVLADGRIHPPVVVNSSGVVGLQFPAAKVQLGYPFNSDGQLMRTEAGAADGTSIGKTRRVSRAAFMLHNVGEISIGMSFTDLIPIDFTTADQNQADTQVPLFSGIKREFVESGYNYEGQICFRQSSGLPGMIQSISIFMEEEDV